MAGEAVNARLGVVDCHDGRGHNCHRFCGNCAVRRIQDFTDLVVKAVRASGCTGLNRRIASGRIKGKASRDGGARCQRDCNLGSRDSHTIQRVAVKRIENIGCSIRAIDAANAVINRIDNRRFNSDSRSRGRAVGGIKVLTDRIVEAVRASRGARINRDATRCRVKREASRNAGAGCNRDGHIGNVGRRPIEGVSIQHVQDIGLAGKAIDAGRAVINRLNRRRDDCDGRGCCRAVCRVEVFADRVVETVRSSRRARINRNKAGGRVEAKAGRNARATCNRDGDVRDVYCNTIECIAIKDIEHISLTGQSVDAVGRVVDRSDWRGDHFHCDCCRGTIGRVNRVADLVIDRISVSRCAGGNIDKAGDRVHRYTGV